jgi:mersacidin/lichenicidin family type 2 lantibiotic
MNQQEIIRSWKDEEFCLSLTAGQQMLVPAHPAGTIKLSDEDLLGGDWAEPDTPSPLCMTVPTPCPETYTAATNQY